MRFVEASLSSFLDTMCVAPAFETREVINRKRNLVIFFLDKLGWGWGLIFHDQLQ